MIFFVILGVMKLSSLNCSFLTPGHIHALVIASLLTFAGTGSIAQVSHGGTPVMNSDDFEASRVLYVLPPENPVMVEGLKNAAQVSRGKVMQYATERPVDIAPDFNGQWVTKEGMHIWRAHLVSPGAYSLGVQFSEYALDEGARIFLYDPSGKHVKGAFTQANNKPYGSFYVGHIPGEEVIIELQVDDRERNYGNLRIGLLSHAFLPVYGAENGAPGEDAKNTVNNGLGSSQACEIDINCREGEEWQILKRSVCHISTSTLLCTGTLVNNTAYNGKPYILTAEHCINTPFYAENSVFYFGYENSDCGVTDGQKNQSVSGSTLLSTGDSIDFTLVELSTRPPRDYNVYYAGWDAREMEHPSTVTLHHPNADAMKISFDNDPTSEPDDVPGDLKDYFTASNYWIRQWDIGSTEGGSSGCPLFNTSKKVVGVLSGGLASCGDSMGYDEVNDRVIFSLNGNENDYYSRLSYGWDYYDEKNKQLKHWLDPIASGQLFIGGLSSGLLDTRLQQQLHHTIGIFPNPSSGTFTIEPAEYTGDRLMVEMYDMTGHRVWSKTFTSAAPLLVSVPEPAPGIYLLRVSDESKTFTGKVVLQ